MADVILKKCNKCSACRPIFEFPKCARGKHGVAGSCKECVAVQMRARYLRNAEQEKAKAKVRNAIWRSKPENAERNRIAVNQWAKENREACVERSRQWHESNRERSKESNLAWRRANPGKMAAIRAAWRATIARAIPQWANAFFIEEAYRLAALRTEVTGFPWHVDHIVPLRGKTVCGLHVESNLAVIPGEENLSKSNRYWPDMP